MAIFIVFFETKSQLEGWQVIARRTARTISSFRKYLKNKKLSFTPQRRIVVEQILSGQAHFDMENLVDQIRDHQASVSRATVYRTVAHLEEAGLLRRIDLNHSHAHFELVAGLEHHEHLICERCGAVLEFSDQRLEKRIEDIVREHGFGMTRHTVQVFGLCGACREQKSA